MLLSLLNTKSLVRPDFTFDDITYNNHCNVFTDGTRNNTAVRDDRSGAVVYREFRKFVNGATRVLDYSCSMFTVATALESCRMNYILPHRRGEKKSRLLDDGYRDERSRVSTVTRLDVNNHRDWGGRVDGKCFKNTPDA